MMRHNVRFRHKSGFALIVAVLWIVLLTIRYVSYLPDFSLIERVFLLMADVDYSFDALGIGVIILLASGYLEKANDKAIRFGLLKWGETIFFAMLLVYALIGLMSQINNCWSKALISLIDTNESGTIMLPLLPASKKLTEILSPYQASAIQLCMTSINYFIYGVIALYLKYLFRNTAVSIVAIFSIHIIGKFALENWPAWVVFTPQSYFYIQNYNCWSSLPTPFTITTLIRMLLILCLVCCTARIGGWICRKNR